MGIDADRVSRQAEQLRSTGMLIIPESPLRLWGSLLGCVGFTVVGVVLILTSNQSSSPASPPARWNRQHRFLRHHLHPGHCQEAP